MYSIVYRSVAAPTFSLSSIYKMLSDARDNNQKKGITGCLLFHKNEFLQLLEGDQNEVTGLYQKIMADGRHWQIQTIKEQSIDAPLFIDWSMAFYDFGDKRNSANLKSKKIDTIFSKSSVFDKPNKMALEYFKAVNQILFPAP